MSSSESSSESSSDLPKVNIITLPKRGNNPKYDKNPDQSAAIFQTSINDFINDTIQSANIHIRVQQRRGKSYITTVEGVDSKLDLKKLLRAIKKTYHCNGSITKDPTHGDILQFSGDQRENVKSFLTSQGICEKNQIITHGF
ncbi:hypothetical protein E24_00486 [Faustovirus]|nr:translation initiation factor SUI1 [Faustovirus]AMN83399.1 hypothetical protein E24_00486 [Faustovirus]AMN84381.1 hypothetical protein D5a_00484 [Faustovirus]AMN85369.1 hypothetical protein E23_00486 [Faustovirus]QBR99360.1 putative translation initiation factor SUI1 [Faustovirus mariensis]